MAPNALYCADCGPPVLAAVLAVHPHLYRMVIPLCAPCAAPITTADLFPIESPEGQLALEGGYTILRGFVVPRPES
jgi:hypothetical protein